MKILASGYSNGTATVTEWVLKDKNNNRAVIGKKYNSGEELYELTGGRQPQQEGSTGRVWVKDQHGINHEFFPGVIGLRWTTME